MNMKKNEASESNKVLGRKKLSLVESATRELVRANSDFISLENEFKEELSVSSVQNKTERDLEVTDLAETRIEHNKKLDVLLRAIYPMKRNKNKTTAEAINLRKMEEDRDEIFSILKKIPPIGTTVAEWNSMSDDDKPYTRGRPKSSLELKLVRARDSWTDAKLAYKQAEKSEGLESRKISDVIAERKDSFDGPGRPSGGEITLLERKIRTINKEIEYIESGQAQKDIELKTKRQMVSDGGKRMGRPFEDLGDKAIRLRSEVRNLNKKISKIESTLAPIDLIQRKLTSVRRKISAQNLILAEKNLNAKVDVNEPEVQNLYRIEATLYKLQDQRDIIKNGGEIELNESIDKEIISDANSNVVAIATTKEKVKVEEKAPEVVINIIKDESTEDKFAAIARKAKKIQEAKLKAIKSDTQKTLSSATSQKVSKKETDALKSIINRRSNG
jgi:hypothetical protein